jgi:hypothetical protein
MTKADSVHSTPPINTSADTPQSSRRSFLAQAAGVAAGGAALGTGLPLPAPAATPDPIFAAIEHHRAAGIVWNAAVDVRADFPEGYEPLTDEQWEQRDELDETLDDAREALVEAGAALIDIAPTTAAGIVAAIRYIQKQTRDDGTFMPFDIEFEFDDGYAGDGGVVLA